MPSEFVLAIQQCFGCNFPFVWPSKYFRVPVPHFGLSFGTWHALRGGGRGRGILPYIGYMGMCCWKGYGFQAIWSDQRYGIQAIWPGIGSSNYRNLV